MTILQKLRNTLNEIRPNMTVEEIRNQHVSNAGTVNNEAVTAV